MVDCGFSLKEVERRLARLNREGSTLGAILLTHEHGDHVRGVAACARKFQVPVWMTAGTQRALLAQGISQLPQVSLLNTHEAFSIGDLQVQPYPVPHDAREPSQFIFSNGQRRFGILTDAGSTTRHMAQQLSGCDALLLECNHDRDMLFDGDYPVSLKERVGGPLGHLDNDTAADLLTRLDCSRLQHVVAAHLSEKNNTPYLAQTALSGALGCEASWVVIADQDQGLAWRELV